MELHTRLLLLGILQASMFSTPAYAKSALSKSIITELGRETVNSKALAKTLLCEGLNRKEIELRSSAFPEIIHLAHSNYLESLAEFGFLNQHITSTSSAVNDPIWRYQLEQELIGRSIPYSYQGRIFLPKYAIANVANMSIGKIFSIWSSSGPDQDGYGDIAFILRPSVVPRTTYTTDDSLLEIAGKRVGPYSRQSEYWSEKDKIEKDEELNQSLPGIQVPATEKNRCGGKEFLNKCELHSQHGACEVQIWGSLDLHDVDSAVLKRQLPETKLALLRSFGIKVYLWSPTDPKDGSIGEKILLPQQGNSHKSEIKNEVHSEKGRDNFDKLGPKQNAELFKILEHEKDPWVRLAVAGELGNRQTESPKVFLKWFSRDSNEIVRSQFLLGLYLQNKLSEEILAQGLSDPAPSVRLMSLQIAIETDKIAHLEQQLTPLKNDFNGQVRDWAWRLESDRFRILSRTIQFWDRL